MKDPDEPFDHIDSVFRLLFICVMAGLTAGFALLAVINILGMVRVWK